MSTVSEFVQAYIPRQLQQVRDYTGPTGWVSLCNQLLRRIEASRILSFSQAKEIGVIVQNSRWVDFPSDYRNDATLILPLFPDQEEADDIKLTYNIVNGKIKLDKIYETDASEDETFVLSDGGLVSVTIDDGDAVENEHTGKLLVLSNGTYTGDTVIIGEHSPSSRGSTVLNFIHSRSTSISDSTAGYLTSDYLIMRYNAKFTGIEDEDTELPIGEKYENLLLNGLLYLATPVSNEDKTRQVYQRDFERDLELFMNEVRTPTPEQARRRSRPMAGFRDCSGEASNFHGYVGETDV